MEFQLSRWDEFVRRKHYPRAMSVYASMLNMSLAVLDRKLSENQASEINRLWRQVMKTTIKDSTKMSINIYFKNNFYIIVEAFEYIEILITENAENSSDLDKRGGFMIQDFMYPQVEDSSW